MNKSNQKLSIIIASVNGLPFIKECLESLRQHSEGIELEIVVADRCGNGVRTLIHQHYPQVKLVEAPAESTVPQLRALAFRGSSGDIVAVLEDHCVAGQDWPRRMLEAHCGKYPVIGGSVENGACQKLVDWAAFFCEYSQAMKPMPEGEVDTVPGNNVSYKRWVLEKFRKDLEAGEWDFVLHKHMKRGNIPLYSIPSITVYHKMSASLGWYILQKFHFARSYAGMRFANSSWSQRILYGGGTILLPFMLTHRIVSRVWKEGRYHRELLLSFPMLMLLIFTWGFGEAVGYIFGAGSSSAKVA